MESIIYPDTMDPYGMYPPRDRYHGGGPPLRGHSMPPPHMRGGMRPPPPSMYDRPMPPRGAYGMPPPPHAFGPVGPAFRVRMQGLPYETSRQDVIKFFHPAEVIFLEFIRNDSGKITECVCEFGSEQDHSFALSRHKENMGRRYIEVFNVPVDDFEPFDPNGAAGGYYQPGPPPYGGLRIHMQGTPFDVTRDEVYEFFGGILITDVELQRDRAGKVHGVVVSVDTQKDYDAAMQLNKKNIRHRYIELFDADMPSGGGPMRGGRPGPGPPRGGGGGRGGRGDYGGFR